MNPSNISIKDYSYHLPEEKIALFPLSKRDASKLLIYKEGNITADIFSNIADLIPAETLLVFNNTRVINARLRFQKQTGANIEIFCLEPLGEIAEFTTVMSATEKVQWKCLVGGAAKWKEETLEMAIFIDGNPVTLYANKTAKLSDAYSIQLSWSPAHYSFAAVIESAGDTPLPPYIKRSTDAADVSRYQTIFAEEDGSVAAPTAGLHFTDSIFAKMAERNIHKTFVTLHVGAGTFKPVKAQSMKDHEMHAEYIDVSKAVIEQLKNNTGHIAAVGTTSVRTVESLYWLGVKAFLQPEEKKLTIEQWDVYTEPMLSCNLTAEEALDALLQWMTNHKLENIFTQTQLLIAPGYKYKMASILTTNFHQPQSTLLLLVAAAIGKDWMNMYDYALQNDFRFLSYGDSNLIFISQ